ncbi:hypothetical protein [Burkholderia guangdongensis]|uniref:hypothetical protein n=1 Tax=Burkholderia guangdongensis TaxID=1792500 RepID=UPI0015CA2223|nr:hypothetical protein [Burkholderia guangdongensis]
MTTFQASHDRSPPILHVFEQAGGWHWGITISRSPGGGFKLIAYSEQTFAAEDDAHRDGTRALADVAATCQD